MLTSRSSKSLINLVGERLDPTDQQRLSAIYTGVAVVLPANTTYEGEEDIQFLDHVSSEFENGLLTVMCIKMNQDSVVPTQLRCSRTIDFFRAPTEQACWQKAIWDTLKDNTSLHSCRGQGGTGSDNTESDSDSTGDEGNDDGQTHADKV